MLDLRPSCTVLPLRGSIFSFLLFYSPDERLGIYFGMLRKNRGFLTTIQIQYTEMDQKEMALYFLLQTAERVSVRE